MKDRNRLCVFYVSHGNCAKGRSAGIKGECAKCTLYKPDKSRLPIESENKKSKLEKIMKKEFLRY